MRNRVPKHQTAKRVSEQHGVVIVLAGFSSCDGEFFNRCQNAVRRCDRFACALAVPECKELQSRCGKILSAPRNVNTDNIDLASRKFWDTRDCIQKMLEAADVAGDGVVLPAVDVNKEKRTFRFMDRFESRFSLRIILGRTLISEFDKSHLIASVFGPSYGIGRFRGRIGMVRAIRRAGSPENRQRQAKENTVENRIRIWHLIEG